MSYSAMIVLNLCCISLALLPHLKLWKTTYLQRSIAALVTDAHDWFAAPDMPWLQWFQGLGKGEEIAFLSILFAGKVVEAEQVPPRNKWILYLPSFLYLCGENYVSPSKVMHWIFWICVIFVDLTIIEIFQCMNKK